MAISLVTKFQPYTDEIFTTESKKSLLTNQDFSWTGAHNIKVYKIGTSEMQDYSRNPVPGFTGSRYGTIHDLDAATEEFTLKNDRSFTFAIDKLDNDETAQQLAAASALARQVREKVVPDVYTIMKRSKDIIMETDIAEDMRFRGVISNIDGAAVIKVPTVRLPENFGFMLAHPCACVAPTKLEDYKIHADPPGISGSLVEGRICYDAFLLDNKLKAIYYQEQAAAGKAAATK